MKKSEFFSIVYCVIILFWFILGVVCGIIGEVYEDARFNGMAAFGMALALLVWPTIAFVHVNDLKENERL